MKAYRNRYMTGCMFALFPCLLLFSCSKEFPDGSDAGHAGKYSESISFGVAPDGSDGNVQTKGVAAGLGNGYVSGQFVLRAQDSADTLCVRAIVSEGIHSSCGRKAVTRATPVDENNFYDEFHVLAYWKKDGQLIQEQFYMDENVSDNGSNRWSSTDTYYWPGDGHSLQFYAWAPVDAFTATPQGPTETTLEYTVPSDVAHQNDLLVTTTEELNGNSNTVVQLTFRHICTAVRFETGSQMQAGEIKSVSLKGVKYVGTYDMASNNNPWKLQDDTQDFSQTLKKIMTGSEADGAAITSTEGTFMMLPQTLPEGATVEVVFVDGTTGTERTLSASIAGMEWPQGTTVTYRISITPEYELEFISEPEIQDAHYIIYPIHIKAGNIPGGWTLTSTDPSVTLRTGHTVLTRRGFWIERDRGGASISSTAVGDNITVLAFLEENVGETTREVNLELRPSNMPNAIPRIFTISQLCPSWNGDLGSERIEDGDYPWGFMWPDGMKITYNMDNSGFLDLIKNALLNAYLSWFTDYGEFITKEYLPWTLTISTVTINFDKVPQVLVATSEDDGKRNTDELYNFNGISDVATLMSVLKNWGGTTTDVLPLNPEEFAARACVMKNKFSVTTEEYMGQTIEVPVLAEEDLVWYLPSKNEASKMQDTGEYALDGIYWTSTNHVTEGEGEHNENAYIYTAGGSTSIEKRDVYHHVRAVRKKP